jgi:hypothetical protein
MIISIFTIGLLPFVEQVKTSVPKPLMVRTLKRR